MSLCGVTRPPWFELGFSGGTEPSLDWLTLLVLKSEYSGRTMSSQYHGCRCPGIFLARTSTITILAVQNIQILFFDREDFRYLGSLSECREMKANVVILSLTDIKSALQWLNCYCLDIRLNSPLPNQKHLPLIHYLTPTSTDNLLRWLTRTHTPDTN